MFDLLAEQHPDEERMPLTCTLNGVVRTLKIQMHDSLLDVLREAGAAGTKRGCETSDCGACAVLVDGRVVNACSTLALQVESHSVGTIEGLADRQALHPLQEAFLRHGAVQCGFCIPGMILTLHALLERDPDASDSAIRDALTLCRCTGYVKPMAAALEYQRALALGRRESPS